MRNKVVLALVGAAILAISCNKDGLFQQSVKDGNGGQEVHGVISLKDGNKIEMSHLGGEMQMSFTTGETWHIDGYTSEVANWLKIYPTSGKVGTTILNVKTDANVDADHSVKLRIVNGSGDSELVSFSVNQPVIVFDVNLKDTGEPFRWNHFVRTRDDKDKPVFNGAKGQKTITIDSNIGWRIDVTEESTQGWCDFDNKSVQLITSRQDKVNILPDRRNFTDTKSLKATIVPLVPSGDDWVRLQELDPLEFTLTQDFLIYRTTWQGGEATKVLGALPYRVAADAEKDGHMSSFTVRSELKWEVQHCPGWLELWCDQGATQPLTGTIEADTDKDVTVWVRTKYANPHTSARTEDTAIMLSPIDDDAEAIPLPVNQEPFVFDFRHNGTTGTATSYSFKSGDSKEETFIIAATGVVDSSWLDGDIPDDWLESQVSDAGNEITFRIAEGKQQLEFTPETTSLTVRPPRDWFDSADAGQDLQRQLSFTQEGFVFKLSGERKEYLSRIGNKATINNSDPTEISVDCTGEWYADISYGTDTKDWVAEKDNKLYNNSSFSSGLTTLKVGASSFNPEAQNRTATLTFISKTHEQKGRLDISGARITLPVSQMAYQLHMSQTDGGSHLTKVDPVPAYLPDGFKLFLTCSGAWDMVCPEFLVPSRASFDNDEKEFEEFINFTVKPNPSKGVNPTGDIVITPRSGNLPPLRIPVSQDPLTFEFKPADVVLPAYSENNVSIGSLKLTKGVKWTLSCEGKDISEFSGKTATGSLETLKVPLIYENEMGNLSSYSRSLTYTVSVTEPMGVSPETITLQQADFIWSVRNTDEENLFSFDFDPVPAESDKINLQVQSSGDWSIEGKGDYINEMRNGENVTLTPTKNLDRSTSREYTLRIKSKYYNYNSNLIQELSIWQPSFEWSVSKDNLSWDSPVNTDGKTFRVESSGPWKLVYGSSEVTGSGGTLDGWKFEWSDSGESVDVTVTPSKNNSFSDHKTTVSVVSIEHQNARQDDVSSKITLSQPKYVLEVRKGQENLSFDAWNKNNENAAQDITLYVTSTDGCDWNIKSNASWLSFPSKRNDSVSVWADNYSDMQRDRTATLTISSAEPGITLTRTVNVTQNRFVFKTKNSSDTNLSFGLEASSKDVQIECSAAWEISSVPDTAFATVTKKDDNTLHIDVSKSSKERTGEIVLASHGNELKINLTQKK